MKGDLFPQPGTKSASVLGKVLLLAGIFTCSQLPEWGTLNIKPSFLNAAPLFKSLLLQVIVSVRCFLKPFSKRNKSRIRSNPQLITVIAARPAVKELLRSSWLCPIPGQPIALGTHCHYGLRQLRWQQELRWGYTGTAPAGAPCVWPMIWEAGLELSPG